MRHTGALGALIFEHPVQIAILAEERQHPFAILAGQLLIERSLAQALSQHLRNVAASIGDHLALLDGFPSEDLVVYQERAARRIDLDFKRHAEILAIAQDGFVDGRNPRRAGVEVVSGGVAGGLTGVAILLDYRSISYRPDPAARTFPRF